MNIVTYVDDEGLYNRIDAATALGISPKTFDKYFKTGDFNKKGQTVGKMIIYKGYDINDKLNELLEDSDHFVLRQD